MGYFKNINLFNFRNFENFSLELSNNCNVLYGDNGCGKTNLLEAISLFAKGRGLRKDKIYNIIKKNNDKFLIKADFENDNIIYNLISETKKIKDRTKKIISINNDQSTISLNSFFELISFLYFLPETERLFISSPTNRRNFFDQLIFTYNYNYNTLINKYLKSIQERSKILLSNNFDNTWISRLEKNISNLGIEIYSLREKQKSIILKNTNNFLEKFNLPFKLNIILSDTFYKKNLDNEFYENELKNNRKIDSILGGSKIGPHRSDFIFYVSDDFNASQLSTGQQKTLILLIYLSQCKYLVESRNIKPILLLDEICSHLDAINRKILLTLVETFSLQIFMTGTNKNLFSFLSTNSNFCNIIKK